MSTPALPQRVPGVALAASSLVDDASLEGDEFATTLALVSGEAVCFECERHPAAFTLSTIQTTSVGSVGQSFLICQHCVGSTAAVLPRDVDVVITRLRKDPS